MILLLFTVAVIVLAIIFLVQNLDYVPVRLLKWDLSVSKAFLFLLAVSLGAYLASFWHAFWNISARRLFHEFSKKIAELEDELKRREKSMDEMKTELSSAQKKIEEIGEHRLREKKDDPQ